MALRGVIMDVDIHLDGTEGIFRDAIDVKVEVLEMELGELRLEFFRGKPCVYEGSQHHVPACSRNTVEVGRAHRLIGAGI